MKKEIKKENQTGVNPIATAVAGAVIGAGVVVAGAVAMNDKNNKEKVGKAVSDVKDKAIDIKENAEKKMEQVGNRVQDVIAVAKEPLE